jgi:hypothetical protein
MVQPIRYVKAHPLATATAFVGGMVFGPWLVGLISRTGATVSVPTFGGGDS